VSLGSDLITQAFLHLGAIAHGEASDGDPGPQDETMLLVPLTKSNTGWTICAYRCCRKMVLTTPKGNRNKGLEIPILSTSGR